MNHRWILIGWLFFSVQLFAVDKFPQRVRLKAETEKNPLVFMVYQRVLSEASNRARLILLSDDPNEQKQFGIENFHANVLLGALQKKDKLFLTLSEMRSNQTNLLDQIEVKNPSEWISETTVLSRKILTKLEGHYPLKDKKTLKKMEIRVRRLSIFEPEKAEWKIRVLPLYSSVQLKKEHAFIEGSYDSYVHQESFGFAGVLEGEWHYLDWLASAGYVYLPNGGVVSAYGMHGFFGSLIMAGLGLKWQWADFSTEQKWIFETNKQTVMPSFSFSKLIFGIPLQINMRRGYFFRFLISPFSLMLNQEWRPTNYNFPDIEIDVVSLNADLMLNMELFPNWNLVLRYASFGMHFDKNFNETNPNSSEAYPLQVPFGTAWFKNMQASTTYYGVGVEYVF